MPPTAPLPHQVSYYNGGKRPKKITYSQEGAARHEAARLARKGFTAVYSALNPRSGNYVAKQTYEAMAP